MRGYGKFMVINAYTNFYHQKLMTANQMQGIAYGEITSA